jgi:DNA-binding NtrC family response regulator
MKPYPTQTPPESESVPFVAASTGSREALRLLRLVAESRCDTVLVLGETGTGKELAARLVHDWRCPDAPFVAVNCATLTETLLESELFGHVKGAFTGADRDKTGLLELAGEGTLYLDEISEMPLNLQAKLLRVLQERSFRPVGGGQEVRCRATVVASSNRDLQAESEQGRFRRDLYFRLAVFPVTLPPLRCSSRREDIPALATHFARSSRVIGEDGSRELSEQTLRAVQEHDWPGNVRELKNAIDRALILSGGRKVEPEHLGLSRNASGPKADAKRDPKDFSLETAEREFIVRALKETNWQRTRAAALLGITRATLHAKLKRYDIQPPESGSSQAEEPAEAAAVA